MRPIDADSVKRGIEELKQSPWYNEKNLDHFPIRKEAVEVVEHLCIDKEPTIDAVPVIRCKDCRNRKTPDCPMCEYIEQMRYENNFTVTTKAWRKIDHTTDEDFCSKGKREEDPT